MDERNLDDLDYKILNLISNDARISYLEVARIAGVSGAAVHQRVQKMTAGGIIAGSGLKLDMEQIGYQVCALIFIQCGSTRKMSEMVEYLASIPQIVECHAMVGEWDFMLKVHARSNTHLVDLVRRQLKPIAGSNMKIQHLCGEMFRRQMTFYSKWPEKK